MADRETSYTLYTLKDKRWEIQATYNIGKRMQAIQDAKTLQGISTVFGVKVVEEDYNDKTGNSIEKVIFIVEKLKDIKKNTEATKRKKIRKEDKLEKELTVEAKPRKGVKSTSSKKKSKKLTDVEEATYNFSQYLIRFIGIIILSILGGLLTSGITMLWLQETSIDSNIQLYILTGLFFAGFFVFIITAMPMISSSKSEKNKFSIFGKKTLDSAKTKKSVATGISGELAEGSFAEFRSDASKLSKSDDETDASDGLDGDAEDKAKTDKRADDDEMDDEIDDLEDLDDLPERNIHHSFVISYLRSALRLADVDRARLDNFNKFAITLFMAGACDTLANTRKLNGENRTLIIMESVKYIGLNDSNAVNFNDRIQEYLLADTRYLEAFQNGRRAMATHIQNNASGFIELKIALEEWNQPKVKDDSTSPVTVLFTDIAGSTAMTQAKGDESAQQIIRVHNRIVRDALRKFNGKEIKHTGDGIMASFPNTSNGVAAGMDIQIQAMHHSTTNPDQKLNLKVGLDTGEPIAEENDLYGATVQLAARIVDKAKAGQVFVSETVYGICKGKNFKFEQRGPFQAKGIAGGLMLYELMWNPDLQQTSATSEESEKPGETPEGDEGEAVLKETPESEKIEIRPDASAHSRNEPVSKNSIPAVFRANIDDYKRLVDKSAENTSARLTGALEYMSETIKVRGGTIIEIDSSEEPGEIVDGGVIIATFPDTTQAIKATMTIQNRLNDLNNNISQHNQVHFRIAIMTTPQRDPDAALSDDDIATISTLNSKAFPGGLCATADVVRCIGDKVNIAFVEGDDEPDHLYRWRPEILSV